MSTPSVNGSNGRGDAGKFAKGNPGGPGNPHARRIGQIRARLLAGVSDDDLDYIIRSLIDAAKAGEPWAVRELLSRLVGSGPIAQPDPIEDSFLGMFGSSVQRVGMEGDAHAAGG